GLLFMNNDGFSSLCGHAIVAVVTIALERGIILPGGDGTTLTFDTPAGTIRAKASLDAGRKVERVTYLNVPSFVMHGGIEISIGSRRVRTDVAFGGAFYAIVDGESVGVPLDAAHVPELRRAGVEIKDAVDRALTVVHPLEPRLTGIYGTIFTGPPRDGSADLRNVTVFANGAIDRSASGTGTAAVMTVIDAMGLVDEQRPFIHESIIGTTLSGRIAGRTMVGEYPAIVPEIEGS